MPRDVLMLVLLDLGLAMSGQGWLRYRCHFVILLLSEGFSTEASLLLPSLLLQTDTKAVLNRSDGERARHSLLARLIYLNAVITASTSLRSQGTDTDTDTCIHMHSTSHPSHASKSPSLKPQASETERYMPYLVHLSASPV